MAEHLDIEDSHSPRVSVVLPTYNRARLIRDACRSVLDQDFTDLELLIVDDASTDETSRIVEAIGDPRIRYYHRAVNGGAAAARNTGIRAALGRFVAFQDSDDVWFPGTLGRRVRAMEAAPRQCPVVVGGVVRIARGRTVHRVPVPGGAERYLDVAALVRRPFGFPQTWVARRDALVAAGGFDESFRIGSDSELLFRLSLSGPVLALPELVARSVLQEDSLTSQDRRWVEYGDRFLEKHRGLLAGMPAERAYLLYLKGFILLVNGDKRRSRPVAWSSVRTHPARSRPWLLLGATLLPRPVMDRFFLRLMDRRAAPSGPSSAR